MQDNQMRFYPETRFGGFSGIDGTISFYTRVAALTTSDSVVLDVGCGRGAFKDDSVPFRRQLRELRGKVKLVIGIDVDPEGCGNPYIDEFRLMIPEVKWPVHDRETDMIICDCVLEHVPDPAAFFAECRRVLKRSGTLCLRTANVMSYFGIAAKCIPTRHHSAVLRTAQPDRREEDIFPTVYRCNTVRALRRALQEHGFDAVVYGHGAEPSYLGFSRIAYRLGALYEKLAPHFLKTGIFVFATLRER